MSTQEKKWMVITVEKATFVVLALISLLVWNVLDAKTQTPELNPAVRQGTDLMQAEKLAQRFDVPISTVLDLQNKGASDTEIMRTLSVAKRAKQNVIDIVALRDEGKTWNEIAARHQLSMADIDAELGIPVPAAKNTQEQQP